MFNRPVHAGDGPLFRDATLRGRVTDPAGNPIEGINVILLPTDGTASPTGSYGPATDAAGNFELSNLPPETYTVMLQDYRVRYATTYYPNTLVPSDATRLTLRNDEVTTIHATMEPGGKITGRVRVESDLPLSSVTVTAFRHVEGKGWTPFETDYISQGDRFELNGLPNGPYRLKASAYSYLDGEGISFGEYYGGELFISGGWDVWVNGAETTTIDWEMRDRTARLGGRVLSESGQPLEGIDVRIYRYNPNALPGEEWLYPSEYTETDANGNYSVILSGGGQYKVEFTDWNRVHPTTYNGNMPTLGGAPVITVTDEDVSDVDVTMNRGGSIAGQVVLVDGSADFRSINFNLYRWNDHDSFLRVDRYELERDERGNFTIHGLTAGQYRLQVAANFYYNIGATEWYGGGDSLADATSFTVEVGATTALETFVVGKDRGVLRGQVVETGTNRPIYPNEINLYTTSDLYVGSVDVSPNGHFEFTYLPAGDYQLYIYDRQNQYVDSADMGYEPFGVYSVSADKTTTVKIELAKGSEINGRVWKTLPLEYMYASAYRMIDGEWRSMGSGSIGAGGWYRISGLAAGDYIVQFSGSTPCCDNYQIAEEYYGDVTDEANATRIEVTLGGYVNGINGTLGNHITASGASYEPKAYGSISGQLTDVDGQPLANVEVFLYRQWSSPRGQTGWGQESALVLTDANGNYRFDDVGIGAIYTTGNFRIGFDGAKIGYETIYYGETDVFDSAEIVILTLNDLHATGINAALVHTGCQISNCQ